MRDEDRIVDIFMIVLYISIIVLRITNVINWGWEWILLPIWLPIVLSIGGLIIGLLIGIPWTYIRKLRRNKNE